MNDSAFALRPPVALDRSAACRAAAELLGRVMARRSRIRSRTWDESRFRTSDYDYHAFVARTRGF